MGPVAIGLMALSLACSATPPEPPSRPGPLAPEQAQVFPVQPGDTLSAIAQQCAVPGGAAVLAAWNGVEDVDRIAAHTPLLVPKDTRCARPLLPARLPRFQEDWTKCTLEWVPLPYDPYAAYGDLTREEVDALEGTPEGGARLDALREDHSRCGDAGRGLTVCWKPWKAPGLVVRRGDTVLHTKPSVTGQGGSGGDVPQLAWRDLDGDGDDEFILTQLEGWSNGISVPGSTILVFEDEHSAPERQGAIFNHADHWLENEQGGCDFLQVTSARLGGPILGGGNYFVGVRHRWTGDALTPTGPTFPAKRLLDRFFANEGKALWDGASAFVWLLDGAAEARPLAELDG